MICTETREMHMTDHQITVRLFDPDARKRMLYVQKVATGLWHWPGGKPKPNESLVAALKREVFEETGLRIIKLKLIHTEFLAIETIYCYTGICKSRRCKKPDGKEIANISRRSLTGSKKLRLSATQKLLQQNIAIISHLV